jgi:hypothetical protein
VDMMGYRTAEPYWGIGKCPDILHGVEAATMTVRC